MTRMAQMAPKPHGDGIMRVSDDGGKTWRQHEWPKTDDGREMPSWEMDEVIREEQARARTQAVIHNVADAALLLADPFDGWVQFDGPATAYFGTEHRFTYVTLCSHGIKPQDEEAPSYATKQEAIELYADQLRAMAKENLGKMLAWRCRPELTREGDRCRVYSRLVFM